MKVALFVPCYVDQVTPRAASATVRLLRRLGIEVVYPPEQTCCGQPAFNTGYWDDARVLASRAIDIFAAVNVDAVVCPSGSCAAMQKVFYPVLCRGTPHEARAAELADKTFELAQFLVQRLGRTDVGAVFNGKAVYHPSCHSLRELASRSEARRLLEEVRGLELLTLADAEECCGFGGMFSVKMSEISSAMGEIKTNHVMSAGADWLISGDASCLLHLGCMLAKRHLPPRTIHLAEVLASTATEPAYD